MINLVLLNLCFSYSLNFEILSSNIIKNINNLIFLEIRIFKKLVFITIYLSKIIKYEFRKHGCLLCRVSY